MVIGIVGYPGVGKTTVAQILQDKYGAFRIDLDKIVHKLYEPKGLGSNKIEAFFGPEFLLKDGSVNRNKLKKVVFGNPQKMRILETFIHPFVVHEVNLILEKMRPQFDLIVIEVTAYRNGAKLNELIDKWILVKRVSVNIENIDGYDLGELHKDLELLKPDFVVGNDSDLKKLNNLIDSLIPHFHTLPNASRQLDF